MYVREGWVRWTRDATVAMLGRALRYLELYAVPVINNDPYISSQCHLFEKIVIEVKIGQKNPILLNRSYLFSGPALFSNIHALTQPLL